MFLFVGYCGIRDNADAWRQSLLLLRFFLAALNADIHVVGIFPFLLVGEALLLEAARVVKFILCLHRHKDEDDCSKDNGDREDYCKGNDKDGIFNVKGKGVKMIIMMMTSTIITGTVIIMITMTITDRINDAKI
jgi:hypothetical protein